MTDVTEENDFNPEFIERQRLWLLARRKSKLKILKEGGELAAVHSEDDIVRIDFALKRIKEKQYGLCTNCGCPIEKARLEKFQPEAPCCVPCQESSEIHTKHSLIVNQ